MSTLPDANKPFAPFFDPVPVPVPGPFDPPLVCVQINETWITYIVGALQVLTAAATWDSDDENTVHAVIKNAEALINALMNFEACPMPIQFRVNPAYDQNWQYSLDGGATWSDGPDTASNFTPTYITDSTSPSGYKLSVNSDHSDSQIPLLTAEDPNAVERDPTSTNQNVIEAQAGVPAIQAQGTQLGAALMKDGVSIFVQKVLDLGDAADPIIEAIATGDYVTAILEIATL